MKLRNFLRASLGLILVAAVFWVRFGHAVELKDLKGYSDTSRSTDERIQELYDLLIKEVDVPTQPHQGSGGGDVDHDYTMAQICLAMWHVTEEDPEVQLWLRQKLHSSPSPEVEDALRIVLGLAGDPSGSQELADLLKKQGQPHRRALAASALGKCGAVLHIPDLRHALHDSFEMEHVGGVGGGRAGDYPVRRSASLALKSLGVTVSNPDPGEEAVYEIDVDSAVRVVEPLLNSPNEKEVAAAILAISQLGGESARETLRRFVDENRANAGMQQLVDGANAALARMSPR